MLSIKFWRYARECLALGAGLENDEAARVCCLLALRWLGLVCVVEGVLRSALPSLFGVLRRRPALVGFSRYNLGTGGHSGRSRDRTRRDASFRTCALRLAHLP